MILRDRCNTSYDQAQYFRQVEWKNRKTDWYEADSSALNFPYLKEVCRIATFLMLSSSKIEEVSRIASFWMVSSSKIEEVSQNCFVLDVVKFNNFRKCRKIAAFSCLQIDR